MHGVPRTIVIVRTTRRIVHSLGDVIRSPPRRFRHGNTTLSSARAAEHGGVEIGGPPVDEANPENSSTRSFGRLTVASTSRFRAGPPEDGRRHRKTVRDGPTGTAVLRRSTVSSSTLVGRIHTVWFEFDFRFETNRSVIESV